MTTVLKYKIIKTKKQYKEYCNVLERLVFSVFKDKDIKDEIALLTVLIEKWDTEHSSPASINPMQLLHSFIIDHELKAENLVEILGASKENVLDLLTYKRNLSKKETRKLADYFKVSQEAFSRSDNRCVSVIK